MPVPFSLKLVDELEALSGGDASDDDFDGDTGSGGEGDEFQHVQFVDQIAKLEGGKRRFVHQTIEDNLESEGKSLAEKLGTEGLSVDDLLATIGDKKAKKEAKKKFDKTFKSKDKQERIPDVLSGPQQERIDRSATYTRAKRDLNKWDAVVHSRRAADTVSFPLVKPDMRLTTAKERVAGFKPKTPLEEEIADLLRGSKSVPKQGEELSEREKASLASMDFHEALAKRNELSKFKALQSYEAAKLRRQNKIKSRKYRKIMRKQKDKEKIRELEELQRTNPELAAEKMEEMEKVRILERASLKHRNTSKYMQEQARRAKHDKNSQETMTEQIRLHRELMERKKPVDESSDEEEDIDDDATDDVINPEALEKIQVDPNNPWLKEETVQEFNAKVTGFLNEQRKAEAEKKLEKNGEEKKNEEVEKEQEKEEETKEKEEEPKEDEGEAKEKPKRLTKKEKKRLRQEAKRKRIEEEQEIARERLETAATDDIDDLFAEAEGIIKSKVAKKLKRMKNGGKDEEEVEEVIEKDEDDFVGDSLTFRTDSSRVLDEGTGAPEAESVLTPAAKKKKLESVDPNNFVSVKTIKSDFSAVAMDDSDDEDEETDQRRTIAEAFADDDVTADFASEKKRLIDASKPKSVDLSLPGWGDWGGGGLKVSKRKRKRFTVRAPPAPKRKDENRGELILNEETAVRAHMVKQVPFPFTSVADFEASIRAPVGDTFVPRTAFKKLIRPRVKTVTGAVIEPMDRGELVKRGIVKEDLKGGL